MVVRWTMRDYWQGQAKTEAFHFTGAVQTFIVPDGIERLFMKLRGGTGGGFVADSVCSGAFVSGHMDVDPGDQLNIRVGGEGGIANNSPTGGDGGYNGGGDGGTGGVSAGHGGGGATDVRLNGNALADVVALAAGSGGNSGSANTGGGNVGGLGGGIKGATAPDNNGKPGNYGGRGGSQTTGGVPGQHYTGLATSGQALIGGKGSDSDSDYGAGGGGAGYEGGGGGGNSRSGVFDIGGGPTYRYHDSYGGGGASSYVGGFNQNRAIVNNPGIYISSRPSVPQPLVQIVYTGVSDIYEFEINPNEGGSPSIGKNMTLLQNTGPNRMNVVQEGQTTAPTLTFSGVILTQGQYENLEYWFDRRVLIELQDDLSRTFYGVFSKFTPKRERRPYNPWYHTYDAEFTVTAYINASGQRVYGRIL